LAHSTKPVVQVGKNGWSAGLRAEIDAALLAHELIKVRITGEAPLDSGALAVHIAAENGAARNTLLAYVRDLKGQGTSSVLVTHNLYHAFQVCDRFVVMSHGTKVFEARKEDTSIEEVTWHVIRT